MHVRSFRIRRVLLKANRLSLLLGALLLCCFAADGIAQPLGITPVWSAGDTWQMKALFRSMDGSWGEIPVTLDARVLGDEDGCRRVLVEEPVSGSSVVLFFRPGDYQLVRIVSREVLRGRHMESVLEVTSSAPVYFDTGALPVFMPLFLSDDIFGPYTLSRVQNGTQLLSVKLNQNLLSGEEVAVAGWLTDDIRSELPSDVDMETANGVVVSRGENAQLFRQLWSLDRPWPVYTESANVKQWVIQP